MKMKSIKIFVLFSAISLIFPAVAANAMINSLNKLTATTQTFATTTDANIRLSVTSAGSVHTFNPIWTGILQPARGGTGASTFATGSILFFQNGKISENNANLFWDNTNNRLGIGNNSPAYPLDVTGNVRWSGTLQGGSVPWSRLTSFPSGCPPNQAVQAIGSSSLVCVNIGSASSAGSVYSISQGMGILITPNPLNSTGTIAIDTNVVPRKNIAETITGDWLFNASSSITFNSKLYLPGSGIWDNNGNVGIGTTTPGQKLSVAGIIESISGGFKFPDGSVQTSAASGGGGSGVPISTVVSYAGTTIPDGWLLADGSAVSRTTYSALFTAIGTKYGAGDGSMTFNLPNLPTNYLSFNVNTNGLISYWPMEGNSNDIQGSNNGSDTNITYGNSYGKFGKGASFDGSSSKIDVGSGNLDIDSGPLTISLWVNFNSISGPVMLFDKDCATTAGAEYRVWAYDVGTVLSAAVDNINQSNTEAHYNFSLSTGIWYHIVFVFDGSNNILYLNGTQVDSEPFFGTRATCSANAIIGQRPADNYGKLDGSIDEVRVYNRALSQTEIQNLYIGIPDIIKY